MCGAPLCRQGRHAFLCGIGGGFVSRSEALERVWGRIHLECGYAVDTQVRVPGWDRWRWRCSAAGCDGRGVAGQRPVGPCAVCGVAAVEAVLEEAQLDLEVCSAKVPRRYLNVTVRHAVGNDLARVQRASREAGATNAEAEADKRDRYPPRRCPYEALPLAVETFGRHGRAALRYLRGLARKQAARLDEGAADAAGALVAKGYRWLGVALQRANARNLQSALGDGDARRARARDLAAALAA